MFYQQQQFLSPEQFQQEEQQRRELEQLQLLKQQLIQQSLLLTTPPPSPMSATLGHPNRSCASCKKRKVKCDRKTPSCTACQKSKHRCQYTSYSPPVFTEEPQQHNEDEGIKAIKQKIEELDNATRLRWEYFQRMMTYQQPTMTPKDEFSNPTAPYYVEEEDPIYNLNLNNPVIPTSTGSQFLQQNSPQSLHLSPQNQLQVPQQQQQPQVSYILPPQQHYQRSPNSTATSPFVQTQNIVMTPGNYTPYMSGTIVLNYNLSAMRSFLGRNVVPILQTMTGGQGPQIPATGFNDVGQLQNWLREKFLSQDWTEEMESYSVIDQDERFELRPIFEESNQQLFSVRQKFEVILHRVDFASSPSSVHGGDFQTYDYEDKMENLTTYSETGSNRSSVADFDPTDVFLNKIYAFVRRFIRNLPWLRENFLANWRRNSSMDTYNDSIFSDGVFSDVVVEVRKISSYSPYQDLKLIPSNEDFMVKGRLFF